MLPNAQLTDGGPFVALEATSALWGRHSVMLLVRPVLRQKFRALRNLLVKIALGQSLLF